VAGIVGPALIAGLRDSQIARGVAANLVYDRTLHIMAGLLLIGLLCNLFVGLVNEKHYMSDDELAHKRALQREDHAAANATTAANGTFGWLGAGAWLAVGIPFLIALPIAIKGTAALL